MSKYKFANKARAHLNEPDGITATQTSMTLDDSSKFPAISSSEVMMVTLDDGTNIEIVRVLTHDTVNNVMTMLREQEGTIRYAFGNATTVSLRPTAEPFNHGIFSLDDNSVGAAVGSEALDLITNRYYVEDAADGSNAIALGNRPRARASDSIAMGAYATIEPDSDYGMAFGRSSTIGALSSYSLAIGAFSSCADRYAVALGYGSYAGGQSSIAIGGGQVRTGGRGSIAIGENADNVSTNIQHSISFGSYSQGEATYGIAIGYSSQVTAGGAVAIGYNPTAGADYSIAIGREAVTTGSSANIAIGEYSETSGSLSMTIGNGGSKATGNYAIALGYGVDAGADNTVVIGNASESLAQYGMAFGYNANASGISSLAIGRDTEAQGEDSIAIGGRARTSVSESHNIVGLSIVKKYVAGYFEGSEVTHFSAQENILMSKDISLLTTGTNLVNITLPTNGQFFVSKVGLVVLEATGFTVDPEISFGDLTSPEELLAQTAINGMVTGKRYEFDSLSLDSQTTLTMSVQVDAAATSYRVRVYFKGFFIED